MHACLHLIYPHIFVRNFEMLCYFRLQNSGIFTHLFFNIISLNNHCIVIENETVLGGVLCVVIWCTPKARHACLVLRVTLRAKLQIVVEQHTKCGAECDR
jgi:hypothetical protein